MTIAENLRKNVFDLLYVGIFLRQFKTDAGGKWVRVKFFR